MRGVLAAINAAAILNHKIGGALGIIAEEATATREPLRIIGNVKGRKNCFCIGCREVQGGESGHVYHKTIATDAVAAGVFPQEEQDDARGALPDAIFREQYLFEPSDDGGNAFGLRFIRSNIGPVSTKPSVALGGDLAKSIDWTVLHGFEENGCTNEHHRFQLPWKPTLDRIRLVCGSVTTALDSTDVGDPIVEFIQDSGDNFISYEFTQQSRQMLMGGLAVAIRQNGIQYHDGDCLGALEL